MRKGGRGKAKKPSILDRYAHQKRTPAKKEKKERTEKPAEDDIEVFLSDLDEDTETVARPRKSPKQTKDQTAGSPPKEQDGEPVCAKKTPKKGRRKLDLGKEVKHSLAAENLSAEPPTEAPLPTASANELSTSHERQPLVGEEKLIPAEIQSVPPNRIQLLEILGKLQSRLLDPLCGGAEAVPLRPSLREVQNQLERLLGSTIENQGRNNSLLLVGKRGVGKTLVLGKAVAALTEKYNTIPSDPRVGFVRLSGLAHTDERVAFREIARQVCEIFGGKFSKQASAYENQDFLRIVLREAHRSEKVIVFLLEEWDLFAKRPKQALLYNLLDACMAPNMQAAVVGVSARYNADELLEKRLKSRFSHTRLLVADPSRSFSESEDGLAAILRALLSVGPDLAPEGSAFSFNAAVRAALEDSEVTAALKRICLKGQGSPRDLIRVAISTVAALAFEETLLQPRHLTSILAPSTGAKVEAVSGLAILELFLLVALERLRRKGREVLNFEMGYEEYASLSRGGCFQGVDRTVSKYLAFKAFSRLEAASLLGYVDSRMESKVGLKGFAPVTLQLTEEELEEGLQANQYAPTILHDWLKREVTSSAVMG